MWLFIPSFVHFLFYKSEHKAIFSSAHSALICLYSCKGFSMNSGHCPVHKVSIISLPGWMKNKILIKNLLSTKSGEFIYQYSKIFCYLWSPSDNKCSIYTTFKAYTNMPLHCCIGMSFQYVCHLCGNHVSWTKVQKVPKDKCPVVLLVIFQHQHIFLAAYKKKRNIYYS